MKNQTFFRVQHSKFIDRRSGIGIGPYMYIDSSLEVVKLMDTYCDGDSHPPPHKDFGEDFYITNEMVFGFNSLDRLLKWFSKEVLAVLFRNEFIIAEYSTNPNCITISNSGKQAVTMVYDLQFKREFKSLNYLTLH